MTDTLVITNDPLFGNSPAAAVGTVGVPYQNDQFFAPSFTRRETEKKFHHSSSVPGGVMRIAKVKADSELLYIPKN